MWPPADITAVPTLQEVIDAKLAIEAVRVQLNDALLAQAHLRVDELNKELIERQAWIAPVRLLSFDVLYLIFEFCGEDDWQTPLRISWVSRHWRQIVLATPRAWAFLPLQYFRRENQMIDLFFSRSGHCPLHIYLSKRMADPARILSGVEKRLKCLSIDLINNYVEGRIFPALDRLLLYHGSQTLTEISHFNDIQFPSLRHLICDTRLTNSISGSSVVTEWRFPPLQTLSVEMTRDLAWLSLLTAVKTTLISLRLCLIEQCTVQNPQMTLPDLKSLDIQHKRTGSAFWPLDLKTPVLETYVEVSYRPIGESLFHRDIQNIRNMRSTHMPYLSSSPLLETLQLHQAPHVFAVFANLISNESLCPNLREVELATYQWVSARSFHADLLNTNKSRPTPVLLVLSDFVTREFPYAIKERPIWQVVIPKPILDHLRRCGPPLISPYSQEVIDAKLAIEVVKTQLSDALVALALAKLRVDELNKELIERQAWIAPVRFLSFDVLSLIFEFCGEDDWWTPLVISMVSRQWREIVLATPRAWAFLPLRDPWMKSQRIDLFFSRSGHFPLHIYLPTSMGNPTQTLSSAVEKRLRCLSIKDTNDYVKDRVFPILDRLTLRFDYNKQTEISHFNTIQFPSLRHLLCNINFTNSISGSSGPTQWGFPPLQTLLLRMTDDMAWLSLLAGVKNTLISLRLEFVEQCAVQNPPMTLPALKYLDVQVLGAGPLVWPLDLKTPVLETYLEITYQCDDESSYHEDTQNVTKMRCDHPSTLSSFPHLEILQLCNESQVSAVFADLTSNQSLCPNLQEVELSTYTLDFSKEYCEHFNSELPGVNRYRRVPVKLVVSNFLERRYLVTGKFMRELPYAIKDRPCGDTMPCNED